MKKILIYIFCFTILFFIFPTLCTVTSKKTEEVISGENSNANQQNEQKDSNEVVQANDEVSTQQYDYKKYKTIKLLHTSTGEVEELNIDEYLYGVVASEMPASFEIEALKAQAVVARTYTIYQIINNANKHENVDICDNYACCQAWISKDERFAKWEPSEAESNWQKILDAVNSTSGKIITYEGKPINAFFHSNSGGITESSLNIWGGIDYPYLKSVETVGESGYTQYSSEVKLTKEELQNKMKEKYEDFSIDYSQENCISILEYTTSNRVKTIKIGNKEIAGTEARTIFALKSTNFTFTINEENIIFSVIGYGHGVGMSQTGADALAKAGSNYEEIIKHFYTGVEIVETNSVS